jgi:phospholipase D1/2
MWAVSMALEHAQREIWILDWWLSPELYLRRPPASNEQYRLDRLLVCTSYWYRFETRLTLET